MDLPIYAYRRELLNAIFNHQVIIVSGSTGCGKTTQLPLFCLEAGRGDYGQIGITQPRRIAATSIARRVSDELRRPLGALVGFKTRFEFQESRSTRIRFMTDGILLTEIRHDPLLRRYDTIMIDEVHERSLNIDFLLGYLRQILPKRRDLRLIISSATLSVHELAQAFPHAPVIDIPGRTYPVDIEYVKPQPDEEGFYDLVGAATDAIHHLIDISNEGDILVFMPTERDIVFAQRRLLSRKIDSVRILPLFSRLPRAQQQEIFTRSHLRTVVLATNVAETSLTVPGIRFVVDSGLARIKRFAPHTRITHLPIEQISQASASQRAGRCGRLGPGMCVRLYERADFESAEQFTVPEILRSNLADVILAMTDRGLGKLESFPFLNPPSSSSVNDGYDRLRELGALTEDNHMTPIGRQMAALPIDCHISRIIIAAMRENALRDVLIIASALSAGDPRERPQGCEQEADRAHKEFTEPLSDFIFFVKLWDVYHTVWQELKTQNRMRTYCRSNFLSYTRMREWIEVHNQLRTTVVHMGHTIVKQPASYDAIHRSLLCGLVSTIGKKLEDGSYQTPRGGKVRIFPGSILNKSKPDWIMAHEFVETSMLFARYAAVIDPLWISDIVPHLCKSRYSDPHFDETTNSVKALKRLSFRGLPIIERQPVHLGKIDPPLATQLFIAQGLVDGRLSTHHAFLKHNRQCVETVRSIEKKLRVRDLLVDETTIAQWYAKRMPIVTSLHDLNRIIKEQGSDDFLKIPIEDIVTSPLLDINTLFPDSVSIGGVLFPVVYEHAPGDEADGATIFCPESLLPFINDTVFDWLIPGLFADRVLACIQELSREQRKSLEPLRETAQTIAQQLVFKHQPFLDAVYIILVKKYQLPETIRKKDMEFLLHLEVHISCDISDAAIKSLNANTSVATIRNTWLSLVQTWGIHNQKTWEFSDLPLQSGISAPASAGYVNHPLMVYPALAATAKGVSSTLFLSFTEAEKSHRLGLAALAAQVLLEEQTWFEKELKPKAHVKILCAPWGGWDLIRKSLHSIALRAWLTPQEGIRTGKEFNKAMQLASKEFKGAAHRLLSALETTLENLTNCRALLEQKSKGASAIHHKQLCAALKLSTEYYAKAITEVTLPYAVFCNFPRYTAALEKRIGRAFADPAKDALRQEQLAPYQKNAHSLQKTLTASLYVRRNAIIKYLVMVEEFSVSLFAQEIKTLYPVSTKRLDEALGDIEG